MNEHIATAVVGLDEAVAAFAVEELDRTCHGHRETPPALLHRCAPAHRPDLTFTAGKLGHFGGCGDNCRSACKKIEALSLRRYHLRKRNVKPVLMARA